MRVLLVEDNDLAAQAFTRLLRWRRPAWVVISCATLAELDAALPADVVVLDLSIPPEGEALVAAVRALHPGRLVLATGREEDEVAPYAARHGAVVLLKPYSDRELLAVADPIPGA